MMTVSIVRFLGSFKCFIGVLCLSCFTLSNAVSAFEVKHVMVDSKVMKFPKIPLKGVKYAALSFEYGTAGGVTIDSIEERSELAKCGPSRYLRINYEGPEVVFRVFDSSRKKSLIRKNMDTSGQYDFGQGQCLGVPELRASFDAQKDVWLGDLKKTLLADARKEMNRFIAEDSALSYEDVRFPLFFIASDDSRFNVFNESFDQARKAFDLYMQFGVTIDAHATLKQIAKVWDDQLNELKYRRNTNSEDMQVMLVLHRNLSITYFFLAQYDQARRHDALAISRGMPKNESLQPRILDHEQRFIYSPTVAHDLVQMANLYRFGGNVVKSAVLQERNLDVLTKK